MNKDKEKYDILHKNNKYGKNLTRIDQMLESRDFFSILIKKALGHSKSLLDVGCSKGWFLQRMAKYFPHLKLTGIDIAEFESEIPYTIADVCDLPFEDKAFDMVSFQDGMEHIRKEYENKAMLEMCRVANQFIYHTISMVPTDDDQRFIDMGMGPLHINIKPIWAWIRFYRTCEKFKIIGISTTEAFFHVILKRIEQ